LTKFNHRIVVLASVNGLRTDCELFEAACAQQGWPILEQPTHPTGRLLREVEYTVEVRIQGAYTGAVRSARFQVEQIGRRYRLDLHALAAQRMQPVGSFVHLLYLDAFGVDRRDVGVPAYWQLFAALRWSALVLGCSSVPPPTVSSGTTICPARTVRFWDSSLWD